MARLIIERENCKSCRLCIAACPKKILAVEKTINKNGYHPVCCTDEEACTGCAVCAVNCPDIVIEVYR